MLSTFFSTADMAGSTNVELVPFVTSMIVALALGLVLALIYRFRSRHTRSFVVTVALLPAIVSVVIAVVNGNVGTGVAVAGAFSLVRFRSAPGSAKDIAFIFLAMVVGLTCGIGYGVLACMVTTIVGGAYLAYQMSGFGAARASADRTLRITVPEDLDYVGLFDDVFERHTTYRQLRAVKTTNMGSLFKLTYDLGLKDVAGEKSLIDELRCRNGNLEVALSYQEATDEL